MQISLIATVLNEEAALDEWIASIEQQTRAPDEIVIVDGGSKDGTLARLHQWSERRDHVRIIAEPGASISRGRNRAIEEARGDVIAVTDAGVRLHPEWLERLAGAVEADVDVVGGFFESDARTVFEHAMGVTVLPSPADVHGDSFLPSSRSVAFRRAAWEAVGGYPEWLDYCEDLVFDLALKAKGYRFSWQPRALVSFRPRGTFKAFFVQYYRYARGDGKADLWRRRHFLRYAAYGVAVLGLSRQSWLAVLLLGAAGGLYCRRPVERLLEAPVGGPAATALALGLIPLIRMTGDLAKMIGYPVGVLWRWQNRPREVPDRDAG